MKKKILGIFIMTLLILTSVISLGKTNEDISTNGYEILFIQEPDEPENEPVGFFSDVNEGNIAYDDFWELRHPIHEIHWWDVGMKHQGNKFVPYNPQGSIFTITLYDDNNGLPGNTICSYDNVMPIITGTNVMYEFPSYPTLEGVFELYLFQTELDTPCDITEGWLSILKTGGSAYCGGLIESKSGNNVIKVYDTNQKQYWNTPPTDLSFALYGYIKDLHGDGTLSWTDVKPGETRTGTLTVENTGGPNTLLDWRVEQYMDWGEWIFEPESGEDLKPEDGPVTITVTVTAPDEKDTDFSGELYIVNANDIHDSDTFPVSLTTSKRKVVYNPFMRFLEQHPHLFPLLQRLLGI